ncbi:hypothetical protein Pan44_34530 [Caulifigura coniformis]|uniref:Uncharacterized protein n=1 Tax=Caulifigura coniformis TaxID=2527983 RepID=A0A517SH16_9PLAN|nr:hypothetical protein [Caulifigura coniformis]QDT55410.1 hypothetical protein Pan44_34530 [Caulifigura coniformis]
MRNEQPHQCSPKIRSSRWHANWESLLAVGGVLLPYIVAIVSVMLFRREIQSHDFYLAGKLATFDTVTGWLTAAALVLGGALCWPWLRVSYRATKSSLLWATGMVIVAFIQFVLVFAVRFGFYVSRGGTFP